MKKLIIITLFWGLLGCAHQPEKYWVKRGDPSEQEFNADKYQCAKEVQAMMGPQSNLSFGPLWYVVIAQEEAGKKATKAFKAMFEMCMKSKGWEQFERELKK